MRLKPLEIGDYKHRFAIKRAVESRDAATNQLIDTEATLATRWAYIEPLRGDDLIEARQIVPDCSHIIRIRYYAGLLITDWGIFKNRRFDFLNIMDVEERETETVILAIEVK